MTNSREPLILPDGEARELREGERVKLRPLRGVRSNVPQSIYPEWEQRMMMLRGKAQFYREEAARLTAQAGSASDAAPLLAEAERAADKAEAADEEADRLRADAAE